MAAQVFVLYDVGVKQMEIAERLNMHQSTVSRILKRHRETGRFSRRPVQGRPRSTSAREDRLLQVTALRNRAATASELSGHLQEATGKNVSRFTVSRRLAETGLKARRPAKVPELLPHHRTERRNFAQEHLPWTAEQWSTVLFCDETRIQLYHPDGRNLVYRRRNERFAPCTLVKNLAFGGGSVMFWAGVSSEGRTELVEVNQRMTGIWYLEHIIQDYVFPYAGFIGFNRFILMHDNARPHIANVVQQYLTEVGIEKLN